jgi:hypothetical protein
MHPWVPAGADGLASGFGVAGVVDPEGVEVPGVDEGFGLVAVLTLARRCLATPVS